MTGTLNRSQQLPAPYKRLIDEIRTTFTRTIKLNLLIIIIVIIIIFIIIGKWGTRVAKQDVINASGAMQVCAGHKSGGEAAIHAMRNIFEADETDAALLVDASNAFSSQKKNGRAE